MGMLIAPCSIRTMSEIAIGVTSSLLTRAADVVLKERRRLVLAVRETPLHAGHLRTMTLLAEMGAIVAPIVPAFYSVPALSMTSSIRPSAGCWIYSVSSPAWSNAGAESGWIAHCTAPAT
jgi:4-hydroxy-3-polyprenylbenzoate decarboxylase